MSANACFQNELATDFRATGKVCTSTPLSAFLREPDVDMFQEKLDKLLEQPAAARFDCRLEVFYSSSSSEYIVTDWEFCKEGDCIVGIGSKVMVEDKSRNQQPVARDRRDLFEVFLNTSENIVFIKNLDGIYLSASPAFCRFFNLSEDELIGRRDADVLEPTLSAQCIESDNTTLKKGGVTSQTEYDRYGRQFEVNKFPFTMTDGTPAIGGVIQEITDKLRLDNRLRYISEQIPGVIFEFQQFPRSTGSGEKKQNRYNYISPKILDYTGYTPEDVIKTSRMPWHLVHPKDRRTLKLALAKAARWVQPCDVEYRSYHSSTSELRWVRSISTPVAQADGSIIWYGIATDITKVKEREKALRGAEHKFHLVAENISDGILVFNEQRQAIYVSASFLRQFKVSASDIKGLSIDDIVDLIYFKDRQRIRDYVADSLAARKEYFRYEYRVRNADGELLWREDNTSVLYDEHGNLYRVYVIARDITRRKEMEEELRSSLDLVTSQNYRLSSFTHIVSHNLRSHVSNMLGLLDLTSYSTTPQENEELIELLKLPVNRLEEALQHLSETVAIQANISKEYSNEDLNTHVQKSLEIVKGRLESVYAKVDIAIPPDFAVCCIPSYLDNILLNLITNAITYRNPEQRLHLRIQAFHTDEYAVIAVGDNGLGIDLERYKDRLFGMYKTFHKNPEARGIGLFITKNQVDVMGGKIEVESSVGPDSGSTFSVYLPIRPAI